MPPVCLHTTVELIVCPCLVGAEPLYIPTGPFLATVNAALGMYNKKLATVCTGFTTSATCGTPAELKMASLAFTQAAVHAMTPVIQALRQLLPNIRGSTPDQRRHGVPKPDTCALSTDGIAIIQELQAKCRQSATSAVRAPRQTPQAPPCPVTAAITINDAWPTLARALLQCAPLRQLVHHWTACSSGFSLTIRACGRGLSCAIPLMAVSDLHRRGLAETGESVAVRPKHTCSRWHDREVCRHPRAVGRPAQHTQ
jgi:hypothetical protein